MILAEIRDYLSRRGRATLSDLAARFGSEPEALRAMLETLIRKGRVRRLADDRTERSCGGCCGCGESVPEIYEWVAGGLTPSAATSARGDCHR